jgi:23S rRNA (adenine2503-C2)-methyltransferase
MGMGEPLDNYDNVVQAIKILSDEDGLSISTRRQTVSTSGISNKIEKLGKEDLGVQLAISLHAVDDELRSELIPMNKAYNIQSIIDAVKKFPIDMRKKVMFEYLVIKNKNDDIKSANKLVKLLNGINAKVNLIYFNPYDGTPYARPSRNNMIKFQEHLNHKGVLCTIRESKGLDISAACGQLKEKENNN